MTAPVAADPLHWWMAQARRYPLLTAEQELTLGRQVQAWLKGGGNERRGRRARDRLVSCNLRLVVRTANAFRRHTGPELGLDDLAQAGNEGLIKAAEKFDPTRGYRFTTYAMFWVRNSIQRTIQHQGRTVRMPGEWVIRAAKVGELSCRLTVELGREPTVAELAHAMGTTPDLLAEALEVGRRPVSLDAMAGTDEGRGLLDLIAAPCQEPPPPADMAPLLATLPPLAGELLRIRYCSGPRLQLIRTVAARLRIDRDRAVEIHDLALGALRGNAVSAELLTALCEATTTRSSGSRGAPPVPPAQQCELQLS